MTKFDHDYCGYCDGLPLNETTTDDWWLPCPDHSLVNRSMTDMPQSEIDAAWEEMFARHQEEVTYFVSPWVVRNDNFAQYAQPRGSQYEG